MAKIKSGPKTKRKGGGVAAKAKAVTVLESDIASASTIIVTQYRGLTVQELQDLRRKLRPRGVEYHVVKNSLFGRAADGAKKIGLRELLSGPTAVAIGSGDEVELAKGLVEESRGYKAFKIVGAYIGGRAMTGDDVQSLAKLPARIQLQALFVGSLQAPLVQTVATLQAPLANLIRVLQARGQQAA